MSKAAPRTRRKPVVEEIEPRILYSADTPLAALDAHALSEQRTVDAAGEYQTPVAAANTSTQGQSTRTHEVVFVDTSVPDYQRLVDDIQANAGQTHSIEVVLIEQGADGIAQITQTLAAQHDVSAVHLISHGTDGQVQLGSTTLDFNSLLKNAVQIKSWGQALTPDADLLIYGCDVAEHADGKALIDALSRLTGTDVAASENPTGAAALGGDWNLEVHAGAIESTVVFSESLMQDWNATLQSTAAGAETLVNTTTSGTQVTNTQMPAKTVAVDPNGNYVVVWSGNGTGDADGVFFERYNANSVRQGTEVRVNSTTTNNQDQPCVAMDGNGNFVVAWRSNGQDGSGDGIYARRFDAAGNALSGEFKVNTTTANGQYNTAIAMNASGTFVIGWVSDLQDGSGVGTYAQRYNASGVAQGSEFRVNSTTAGDQWLDSVGIDATGKFTFTLNSTDANASGTFMRRYDAAGNALTGDVQVNSYTTGDQGWSSMAMNADGTFVVAWVSDLQDGSLGGIYAQRFDSSGVAQGSEFRVNTTTANDQQHPVVAIDGDGNFTVVWVSYNQDAASTWGVYKQEYNADGTKNGGETRVTTTTAGDQTSPSIAMNALGQTVIAWSGNGAQAGNVDGSGVFTQRYAEALVVDTTADTVDGTVTSISALLNNKGADGKISLREAVTAANNSANVGGADRIYFNISGSTTISIATELPHIADTVIIDGTTQAGYAGTPLIELSGSVAEGLYLDTGSSGSTIKGLDLHGFHWAIDIAGSSNNVISGNFLGTDRTGTVALGNWTGVWVGTSNNTIGGTTAADRNIISGNTVDGVQISGSGGGSGNVIIGNYIGLDVTGTVDLGNTNQGVALYNGAKNNTIGGTAAGAGNVISGNNGEGVRLINSGTTGNVVLGNLIGTNAAGTGAIANGRQGVWIDNAAASNTIGGTAAGADNTIAYNTLDGVALSSTAGAGNSVLGNAIFSNGGLGIDLSDNGVTANDGAKTAGQPNLLMDFPVIQSALLSGTTLTISGYIGTAPNDTDFAGARVEFFESPDAAGANGEGQTYLGFLTADATGNFSGTLMVNGVAVGDRITATATDVSNNTSEFGANVAVAIAPPIAADEAYSVNEDSTLSVNWWDTDWTRRSQITFTGNNFGGATNLTDFPVLIALNSGNINYAQTQNQGQDLRFLDANGAALDYQIESWNESGTSYVWVKVPQINAGNSDFIWMYYGNAGAPAGQDPSAVWTNSYSAVYHLNDAGTSIDDATANSFDGTAMNGAAVATGQIAGGRAFDGSNDYINLGANRALVNNASGVTFSAWVNTSSVTGGAVIMGASTGSGPIGNSRVTLERNNAELVFRARSDDATSTSITTTSTALGAGGTWHYVTAVVDVVGDTMAIYVDGVAQTTTGTPNLPGTQFPGSNSQAATIGSDESGGPGYMVGSLDEVRFATATRSAAWVRAEYLSMTGSFVTVGAAQTAGSTQGVLGNDTDPNGYPMTAVLVSGPANAASFTLNVDGTFNYTPTANFNGTDTFTYRANDGLNDSNLATVTITVNSVNDAPAGTNKTVTTNEDTAYTFSAGDFGFTDPNDSPANTLTAVRISTVPGAGSLMLSGVAVTAGQSISVANINAGNLKFAPAANANGVGYASFTFQVQDNGGTANGGVDLDASPNTMTVNVTAVNDAPAGTNNTVTTNEDTQYTFATADFGFTDPNDSPANSLTAVKITAIPGAGSLTLSGVAVTAGQTISAANIASGNLKFSPAANANGTSYTSFTFQVQDNGGTANGGVDLDQSPNTMTVNVTAVNDAPAGTNNTVATNEDTQYTFAAADFGFTDPNDSPANTLTAVKITTIPGAGSLTLSGVAVTAGQTISAANIASGNLKFTPAANANGASYATFTFQVQDDGGTANGGVDLDASPNTMTINVTAVNDAPAGTNNTVTTNEDTQYTFAATDFGFTDSNDSPANTLTAVRISTVPGAGSLMLSGVAVTAGQSISVANINAGNLKFAPAANANGVGYASFTFQVQDNGGTANGGVDLDASPNTMTVNVTAVNDAPAGTNNTVTTNEDTQYTFATADFGFTDPNDSPANSLTAVKITAIPGAGSLTLSGVAVTAGQTISAANIASGNLKFSPAANANGTSYTSFTFQVQDNGGTANGGVDLDQSPNTMTVNVTAVNDAPAGTNNTVATNEDTQYTFAAADFGFTDPNDSPANTLTAVKITTIPGAGSLTLSGVAVTAGQTISAANIASGNLKFTPAANANGASYATFTFQVQDDGGTANGGVDLDASPNTMTINVTAVNDAPAGTNNTVTTNEDTQYTFAATDFGFTDSNDSPANTLTAVRISTVPGAGSLMLSGVAVTAGQSISVANINAGNLKFAPAANANGVGYASFTFQVQDNGGTANGGVDLDASPNTMTVNVTAVNDAPVNTVPAAQTTTQNTPLVFSTPNGNRISIADVDAGGSSMQITLTGTNGTITLNGTTGLSFSVGDGTGDATMTFAGTISDLNAALDGLTFDPTPTYNGGASLAITTNDQGNTGSGGAKIDSDTVAIDVSAAGAPTAANDAYSVNEDTPLTVPALTGLLQNDTSPSMQPLTAIPMGGPSHAASFMLNANGSFSYTPAANFVGTDTFTYQVDDGTTTSNIGTVTITVNPVNDAPSGTDNTVVTNEDTQYTFAASDFGFTDPNDNLANNLSGVKISALPVAGSLTLSGAAVTVGQTISVANITAGNLKFTTDAGASGAGYASFTFQVQDDGGTASGGVDLDQSPNTMTIDVTSVNDAPAGTDHTVTTNEDAQYTFASADFGFTDPNDGPANALVAVRITTIPGAGSLTLSGVAVAAGQAVSAANIAAGNLRFAPPAGANGASYASFTFQVQDDGGTANGGVDLDQSPNTMTVDVTSVNDAPAGTDHTVTTNEVRQYTFAAADFGFTDADDSTPNALSAVKITTIPGAGSLTLSGVAITGGQTISLANINAGNLKFSPAGDANGAAYASFTFQVQDDGGTANGGVDLDQSPNTMTIDVTAVNDAPTGTDQIVTTQEDTQYTFAAADFGFADAADSPVNSLIALRINTIPGAGSLTLSGVAVIAGQSITLADLNAGNLEFSPAAHANGAGYASFTFQVQDDGGTANGGVDLDQSPNTITIDVTSVNDAPTGTDNTVTTNEDTQYTFAAADFGFGDATDAPANNFSAVRIATIPGAGSLMSSGVAVTAGQTISIASIAAGNLKFTPAANANGTAYGSFTFQVQDDGGTLNGGVDLDASPSTITIDVTAVNDAPSGTDQTVTTQEDTQYTFVASDFGFDDSADNQANALSALCITTIPFGGSLTLSSVAVVAGQYVSLAELNAGNLQFTPAADASGGAYASFTFQVQDDGGTLNGGVDLDQSPNTMTIDVDAVNDAPAGADNTVTTNEDTAYTFNAADFGFSDASDNPVNSLIGVRISSLPALGSLTDNGVALIAGQTVTLADIVAGNIKFTPAANANGAGYASFTFQVQDDGGTANGGVDLDQSPNTMTIDVTSVNDAPAGTDHTVTTNEDAQYTFASADFGFTDPNDGPANALVAVRITTIPGAGSLTLSGVAVTAGQAVSAANIAAGNLRFAPPAGANGASYASFTFQVQDDGGTANGGVDLDQSPNTMTVDVTSVNDAPAGTDHTVTTNEDTQYTFAAADFGFTDADDSTPNALSAVKITTIPGAGSLTLSGVAITGGQTISLANINAGNLKFSPAGDANGAAYASFTFQVQDDGGTANGGVDLDQSPNTMTIDVTAVNDAPTGTDQIVTTQEDTQYTFAAADFGFADAADSPVNSLIALRINTIPGAGSLTLSGVAVIAGQSITLADLNAGNLEFSPAAHANGAGYASFTFQVQDDGGTANGGVDLDQSPNTMTIDVTSVNDAPAGTDHTVTTNEDAQYTFASADFGFTDPNDGPANALVAVRITTIPGAGSLTLSGVAVTAGQAVSAANIAAGNLRFAPPAGANGASYASFTFQVQDDGGTANGGVDLDQSPNTMTVDVTSVNDAPAGTDHTVTTNEDTQYTFAAADFGFTDADDSTPNALSAVKITTIPGAGSLTLSGVAITGGQTISLANINAGNLKFSPAGDANGAAYASFTFQVQDDGGTANGGVDLDQSPNTMTIDVTAVNDAPTGTDQIVTTQEDTQYTFAAADFGFADAADSPVNSLIALRINTIPGAGSLTLSGVAVIAGQSITLADLNAGNLEFSPAAHANGAGYASFTFQVQDDGGTANGGVDLDQSPNTITIDVNAVNDAPVLSGASDLATIDEDATATGGTLVSDLLAGYVSDVDASAASGIAVTAVDNTDGTWEYSTDGGVNWTGFGAPSVGAARLLAADASTYVRFVPSTNFSGPAGITFRAWDQTSGVAGGTADTSVNGATTAFSTSTANASITVNPVNDAPAGIDGTVVTSEDTPYAFKTVDLGLTDADDTPANVLLAVKITTLPGAGSLTNNGVTVVAGDFISVADVTAGKLVFTPMADANGTGYSSFTFQVQDDGGTANGGVDLDPIARTMTIDVTAVNDAPMSADNTVTTAEDSGHVFTLAEFSFSDPSDGAPNTLTAVKISTLPGVGTLTDNGVAVAAGTFIPAADIAGGKLVFTPAVNANGAGYASFTFQAQDDGGTANGGADLDPGARIMTIDVTAVDDAPVLGNNTLAITQGGALVMSGANLSATDIDNAAVSLMFSVSNVMDGRFELVAAPGVAVSTFTQGQIAAGQVRFVHDGSSYPPAYDIIVSDGSLSVGPSAATVGGFALTPAAPPPRVVPPPVAIVTPPPPVTADLAPASEPAVSTPSAGKPGPDQSTEAGTAAMPGGRLVVAEAVSSPAPEVHGTAASFMRLEVKPIRVSVNLNPEPQIRPLEMTLTLPSSEPTYAAFGLSAPASWSANAAFPDQGHRDEGQERIEIIMEGVEMSGIALSVGVVWWVSRVGGLVGSLLASTPAWRHLDPLPIIGRDEDEEESSESAPDDVADAEELAVSMVLSQGPRERAPD